MNNEKKLHGQQLNVQMEHTLKISMLYYMNKNDFTRIYMNQKVFAKSLHTDYWEM